ncbi:MAG: transketolase [Armatimonadetes bacterium]|nr:transketolase [Armatimonadota bacterium]
MVSTEKDLDEICINTLRGLAIDAVQKANSGHPGLPLGAAPFAYVLWDRHLKHNPADPSWFNRDRFVLSAGHGSMLLYGLLHLFGYDLSLEEIKSFRQWGSKTPGHPENHLTPGVETATGPLGQGISTAVGMAVAERFLAARFNRPDHQIVDHYTYVLASDGDLMEGVTQEACSFAGHQKLGKLIVLYDDNEITIDGSTELTFTEDVARKFDALGWHVQGCDGNDLDDVDRLISLAKDEASRPSLIICKTTIGYGSPNKAGSEKSHGAALGVEEVALTKQALDIPEDDFFVPEKAAAHGRAAVERGLKSQESWMDALSAYASAHPNEHQELVAALSGDRNFAWLGELPTFRESEATRNSSSKILNEIAAEHPTMIGGCADLAGSVKTEIKDGGIMSAAVPDGRNVRYGVREHAMAAIVNGMTLHRGTIAFGGTFLIFSDYCRPSLRIAALMQCPSIFLFSHDSIGLGEDGPTHQPIEHVMSLRAIPNFNVMRPADGNETAACWKVALESTTTPSAILLTRQNVRQLSPSFDGEQHPAERGAYVLRECEGGPQAVLVATGSEVEIAVDAATILSEQGIACRVVSMPSWHLFERQDADYRRSVLPPDVATVSVEAGRTFGWSKYAQAHVGIDRFGASAPAPTLYKEFGITADAVASKAAELIGR